MEKNKLEEEAFVDFPELTKVRIEFNPKSYKFTRLISYLHSLVAVCEDDVTLEMNLKYPELLLYGISPEYLILRIEEYFLPQLEKY